MAIIYPPKVVIFQHQMKPESYQHMIENNGPQLGMSPEDLLIAIEEKAERAYHVTTSHLGEYDYIKQYRNRILDRICG